MKAVFIDAKNGEVREVTYDGNIDSMYKMIGCELITSAVSFGLGHALFVDDEGYINGTKSFFRFKSIQSQWFAGNGMIVREVDGKDKDHHMDVERIRRDMVFMTCDDEESCPKLPPMKIITFE